MRRGRIEFDKPLQVWDGFGINYVEAAQTRDYAADPQEYGGFSTLSEADRQAILELIFGEDGLQPGVAKMFLDPFHQAEPGPEYDMDRNALDMAAYDHETTTQWMRYFMREGVARTRARGGDIETVVTLYGPPAWMTAQRFVRGRDLDPAFRTECAKYMISWAKYLREVEGITVKYISLHNEGEDWQRWPLDGSTDDSPRHDYNLYWTPEQVADFVAFMPAMLEAQGMGDVGVTPGEPSNWYRFHTMGYPDAIADNPESIAGIGLITSHGFFNGTYGRWYGDHRSVGIDILHAVRPDLRTWVTSTSWAKMDVMFVNQLRNSVYSAKVNAIIPWAAVQTATWVGGDPNPGTAIRVDGQGGYTVEAGYYYYKQACRAGQPGMRVARVRCNDPEVGLLAFAGAESGHPDAFLVFNIGDEPKETVLELRGQSGHAFSGFRTSPEERYAEIPDLVAIGGEATYTAPPASVTTFYGKSEE